MTVPPSPKNSPPKPGTPPPTRRFQLATGPAWIAAPPGTKLEPELLKAGLVRREQRDGGGMVPFGEEGLRAWVKGGRLSRKSSLRHGASSIFARRPVPRLAEMANLLALGQLGIPAAVPLLAGLERGRFGEPTMQFLATAEVPCARNLLELLIDGKTEAKQREVVAVQAGSLAATMHMVGFEHRNYFLRNLLLDEAGELVIVDAWRGGLRLRARAFLGDIAGFLADAHEHLGVADRERFLESYAATAKGTLELPSRDKLAKLAARARSQMVARLENRAARATRT